MKTFIQWLIQHILAHRRLKRFILGLLAKQPRLDFWLRHRLMPFIFNKKKNEQHFDTTEDIFLAHTQVKFHTAALADNRGIGRVSQALLKELQLISRQNSAINPTSVHPNKASNSIHFYPTIHWCPKQLPPASCILIHDVIPLIFPEYFGQISQHWQQQLKPIAQQAQQIITISQASAADIATHLAISPDKITVIYNGITPITVNKRAKSLVANDSQVASPYVVFLGSNDPHKNIEVVLKALPLLKDKLIQLHLIGHNETVLAVAKQYGVAERVQILGRLDDQQLAEVIQGAIALVFPSLYEGFGLPPFEAAFLDTPAICSRRPAMTELLEGACLFCDPYQPQEWADAIQNYADDAILRQDKVNKAQKIAQQLNWHNAAQQFVNVFTAMQSSNKH